jgi:hypothetical protein
MNRNQKSALIAGMILVVLMLLFPPWRDTRWSDTSLGYSFLWAPPQSMGWTSPRYTAINYKMLFTQWFAVIACAGGTVLLFKDNG